MKNVAYLNILTWAAHDPSAEHYFGTLYYEDKRIELEYTLSSKDALDWNKKKQTSSYNRFSPGDTVVGFPSEQAVIEAAKKECGEKFPCVEFILRGDGCSLSVVEALSGPKKVINKINRLYKEACELGYYSEFDEDINRRMEEIDAEFRRLLVQ